jgi:hypothetical protein
VLLEGVLAYWTAAFTTIGSSSLQLATAPFIICYIFFAMKPKFIFTENAAELVGKKPTVKSSETSKIRHRFTMASLVQDAVSKAAGSQL